MKTLFLTLISSLVLTGCAATVVDPFATGGSRSDGTVKISYEGGLSAKPPSAYTMKSLAADKCRNWGYKNAEAFGSESKECRGEYCFVYVATIEYQCLGELE